MRCRELWPCTRIPGTNASVRSHCASHWGHGSLATAVCCVVLQRTTISELEEQVYQVEELEEKVADLTQRLEDAEKLTPDGAAKRIRALEECVVAARARAHV